jgi:hypothetical protein
MASQLAGYDQQGKIANAQLGQQAALANAQMQQQGGQFNAGLAQNAALANQDAGLRYGALAANYDLGAQGLGVQSAGQQANYDLGLRGLGLDANRIDLANRTLTSQNAIAGAGLANQAAQIPLQNLQSLYGVGQTMQQAPWNQYGQYANLLSQSPNSPGNTSYQAPQQTSSGQTYGGLLNLAGGIGSSLYDQYLQRNATNGLSPVDITATYQTQPFNPNYNVGSSYTGGLGF